MALAYVWQVRLDMFMASGPQVQAELAASEGLPPAALARDFAELRDNDLVPTKKPFEVEHIVRALLSRVARRPREIASVVRSLELLPWAEGHPKGIAPPAQSLGLTIADVIHRLAERLSRGEVLDDLDMKIINTWHLQICLNPLQASIAMEDHMGPLAYEFGNQEAPLPPLVRLTWITGGIILSMARLLADTYINENAIKAIQFLDRTRPAKATSENENADTSPKVPALSTDQSPAKGPDGSTNQSHVSGSDASHSTDTNGGCALGEVSPSAGTGHDSDDEPDLFDPARSARCLIST